MPHLGRGLGLSLGRAAPARPHLEQQPPPRTVTASMRPVAAFAPHGCSLRSTRLQPPLHTVAASAPHGCSLRSTRLQPPLHTVAASAPHCCRRAAAAAGSVRVFLPRRPAAGGVGTSQPRGRRRGNAIVSRAMVSWGHCMQVVGPSQVLIGPL